MRILCTNDDGIHAPGLKTLEKIAPHSLSRQNVHLWWRRKT